MLVAMAGSTEQARVATGADAEEVAELLDRFQVEYDEPSPGAHVLASRVRDHIGRGLSVFLLAGPQRTGVAQLRFREWLFTGEPICYVEELYVVPDRRREGHGRALMMGAMQFARDQGATTIELTTATSDTAARGLYESLGFTNLEKAGQPETQMLYYERELG
jgi:ribosomal protein S18 acetylase RimI-like enzyme